MRGLPRGARRVALVVAAALLAPIGVVATTAAPSGAALPTCTKTWTAAVDGDWYDATKWTGGTVPTSTDHVCITVPGDYTVALTGVGSYLTVASLTLGTTTGDPDAAQELLVTRGGGNPDNSLTATDGIVIEDRGRLTLGESDDQGSGVSVGVGSEAEITVAGGHIGQAAGATRGHTLRGDLLNQGSIDVTLSLRIEGDLVTDGTMALDSVVRATGTVHTRAGAITGDWAIVAQSGLRVGEATLGGNQFSVEDGGYLALESDEPLTVAVYGRVTLEGDIAAGQRVHVTTQDDTDTELQSATGFENHGTLWLTPNHGAAVTVDADGIYNLGQIEVSADDGATIDAHIVNEGVVLSEGGDLTIDGNVANEGLFDLTTGTVTINGDLAFGEDAELAVGLTDDPFAVGRLDVAEGLFVDGALSVHTDVAPAVGAGATVVNAGELGGTFATTAFTGTASYDVAYSSTQVNLTRRAPEPATQRFVRAAYADFLDRAPTTEELAARAAAIDGGASRASLVRELSRSTEYLTTLVEGFYRDTLERPGDADGVTFWVGTLRSGRYTPAKVAASFYASEEYRDRLETPEAWIEDLYQLFLLRSPSEEDRDWWVDRIALRGPTRVALELYESLESRGKRVDALYLSLLDRWADEDGLGYWAARLTREGDLALAVFLAASPEYLARAQVRYP